jgi:putative ABC transport system permease protein
VIGVLAARSGGVRHGPGRSRSDPLRACRRIAGNSTSTGSWSRCKKGADEEGPTDIELLLRERRRLGPREEADFHVMDMQQIVTAVSGTTQTLTALLGAVAAVSLLVGGIGIMNIMLVSVTERTREIGIRLAIGAMENEVLMQFSSRPWRCRCWAASRESSRRRHCGGAPANVPFVFNAWIVAIAFLFSGAVGVIFGYFPARKAAQLNPIDALRHE